MIIQDAIRAMFDNMSLWIRPVSWSGSGTGITIKEGRLVVVPSSKGGFQWSPDPIDICEGWEVMDAKAILGERP